MFVCPFPPAPDIQPATVIYVGVNSKIKLTSTQTNHHRFVLVFKLTSISTSVKGPPQNTGTDFYTTSSSSNSHTQNTLFLTNQSLNSAADNVTQNLKTPSVSSYLPINIPIKTWQENIRKGLCCQGYHQEESSYHRQHEINLWAFTIVSSLSLENEGTRLCVSSGCVRPQTDKQ